MGFVVWITGLPGSGKSTISEMVKAALPEVVILRMDDMRRIVTPEPSYSEMERELVYRSLVYTAKTVSDLGHPVIIDATGNRNRWRDLAREIIPDFSEIYLKCPLERCTERERERKVRYGAPQEIYDKAGAGWPVPGVTAPYEEPLHPELVLDVDAICPEEAARMVVTFIGKRIPE
ncbi:MAG: adenylyl-sulfate kinase [Nitrospirales bacterium]|nr:adenylyl-sulfate kinase [Nitrospirales bacterium]